MRRVIFSAMAAALVILAMATDRLLAAKPTNGSPASVTFRNWVDDNIKSDGLGPYVDGQHGSVCRIYTGGSEDLTIGTFQSGRTMWFFYTPATGVTQPTLNPPSGTLQDNAFMNIRNIGAMAPGETKLTLASFITAVGYFRWLNGQYGSQAVVVTRNTKTNWTVSADLSPAGASDGDLAVLLKDASRNTVAPVGLYHMPFGLDVNCPTCP